MQLRSVNEHVDCGMRVAKQFSYKSVNVLIRFTESWIPDTLTAQLGSASAISANAVCPAESEVFCDMAKALRAAKAAKKLVGHFMTATIGIRERWKVRERQPAKETTHRKFACQMDYYYLLYRVEQSILRSVDRAV